MDTMTAWCHGQVRGQVPKIDGCGLNLTWTVKLSQLSSYIPTLGFGIQDRTVKRFAEGRFNEILASMQRQIEPKWYL